MMDRTCTNSPKYCKYSKNNKYRLVFSASVTKVQENEELIRQIINEGHLIGNHSFTHTNHFPLYSLSRMKKDLQSLPVCIRTSNFAENQVIPPTVWSHELTIAKAVRILGYTPVGWNIRTLDTLQPSKEKVLKRIQKRLRPGSIILLHDRMPDSDLLLKEILNLIKEQGYTVVRLDSML